MLAITTKSLAEIAAEKIRRMIISGKLGFGQQVVENDLAEMFGLSKTPVREALLRLASEGLILTKPRRGSFVFTLDAREIRDISYTRLSLEQAALRFAMQLQPAKLSQALGALATEGESRLASFDKPGYLKLDHSYHKALLGCADNNYLIAAHHVIVTKVQAMRFRLSFLPEYVEKSIREHSAIAEAVLHDDADAACAILADHINSAFTQQSILSLSQAHAAFA